MPSKKKKKARLGRGLDALLGDLRRTTKPTAAAAGRPADQPDDRPDEDFKLLPIEQLQRGKYQPRRQVDEEALAELAASIRSEGVLQPLLVRPLARGGYEIVAGERRWRGAQMAGLHAVPVVVRDLPDQTAMAVALIENIQRQDLNAIDQAMGFARLLDEFGLTHEQIAAAVGRSRAAVTNILRLLKLAPAVRELVESGALEMGHARALLALPESAQAEAARQVVRDGLSVRATERLVKRKPRGDQPQGTDKSADIVALENRLAQQLGAVVAIEHGSGRDRRGGKLVIRYHSLDELDGILQRIR